MKEIKKQEKCYVGIAQINLIAGDIEYNAKKIVKNISHAQNSGLDLVVFPELTLIGCRMEDTIKRHPIIVEENKKWLNQIAKITTNTAVVVGFIDADEKGELYDSLAILYDGKIQNIIKKDSECIKLNGIKYGILIDGDIDKFSENPDVLIYCKSIPSRAGNEEFRNRMLSQIAQKFAIPLIYVNQVGAIDNISFDGCSKVFDRNGNIIVRAKSFEEQFLIVNSLEHSGEIYPLPDESEKTSTDSDSFSLNYDSDLERTYKTIIQGIRDYFSKTGFERAVLGLSGGLDSSVCAVLLADALGAGNVLGISMPSKITSNESKNDAELLAKNLKINFAQAAIKDIFEITNNCFQNLFKNIENKWSGRYAKSFTPDNIQARARAMFLWGVSNEFAKTLPIATSDKSETYMGYATINGDMSGGFAPIADVTKTKLFALARWMNENREEKNAIPQSIIDKKPGAELAIDPKTNKPLIAEDALMPYEFLDEIIWRIENKKESYNDMLNSEFLYEKNNSVSRNQKTEWLDKFYHRMSTALYKWSITAPSVIVDTNSINKCEYSQPITSSKIDYRGKSETDIEKIISSYMN